MSIVHQVQKIALKAFNDESIDNKVYFEMYHRNQFILAALIYRSRCIGYFDIFPLRSEALSRFKAGKIIEADIMPDDILGPERMRKCKALYFAGMVTYSGKNLQIRKYCSAYLIGGVCKYIEKYYGFNKRVIGTAATESGERYCKSIGTLIQSGSKRRDGHNLYEFVYKREFSSNILKRVNNRVKSIELK